MMAHTPLDHARDLLARGLSPIPVPHRLKAPRLGGWQTLRLASDDLPRYFNGAPGNVGALLGEPSGWIVDVDLDHPRALELADRHLPTTGMAWGRKSKPRSHRLYRLTRPGGTHKWTSGSGMIVELRSTGCQTIAPGSTHPSGEVVRWDADGDPAPIDPSDLLAMLDSLAEAVRSELGETAAPGPPAPLSPTGASAYGRAALQRETDRVARTPEGTRNDALNEAAFSIGTLIGGGEVDRAGAEAELLAAARACGLPEAEAARTIASGIRAGMAHPRRRPEAPTRPATCADPAPTAPTAPTFSPLAASDLIREHPHLRPVVIADLLREGEVLNVIAAPKVGKSWLVHALSVAVVAGVSWLGKTTASGDVLLIDAELHPETLAGRLRAMQRKLVATDAEMARLKVWSVRGRRLTVEGIADALADVPRATYRLIVFDALYRFLPPGGEENANETMTRVYNTLDAIADQTGAAVVVVHHTSKGDQSAKSVTDIGSGAGAQSRAADTHLILRPHEEDGAAVVEAVVRSFPPPAPFVVRREYPGWSLAPDLDPSMLRKPKPSRKAKDDAPPPEPMRCWTPGDFAAEIVGPVRSIREDVFARARAAGQSKAQADELLRRATEAGLVHRHVDGPSEPHRFSTTPPDALLATEGGGEGEAAPPPGVPTPGGMGGTARPPSPPTPAPEAGEHREGRPPSRGKRKGRRKTGGP